MVSPEHPDHTEQRATSYHQAARFARERRAKKAYFRAQETIFRRDEHGNLSVYRFLLNDVSHVAVVGETPPAELDRRLRKILAAGEPVSLPAYILKLLFDRRAEAVRQGHWVERHYRPGQPL